MSRGPSIIPDFERPIEPLSTPGTISPVALESDIRSVDELPARLAGEYGAHLSIMDQRLDDAPGPRASRAQSSPPATSRWCSATTRTYPFRVEPYFKAWVPLTLAPGSFLRRRPGPAADARLQAGRGLLVRAARAIPKAIGPQHFDIRIARSDAEARKLSGAGPRWVAIGWRRTAGRGGSAALTPSTQSPEPPRLTITRRQDPVREPLHARRQAMAVRGDTRPGFQVGHDGLELHQAYPRRERAAARTELPYGKIIALNEHAATLHYQHFAREVARMTVRC